MSEFIMFVVGLIFGFMVGQAWCESSHAGREKPPAGGG